MRRRSRYIRPDSQPNNTQPEDQSDDGLSAIHIISSENLQDFMDFVQYHERDWGEEQYVNRPDLADIIGSPVVAFWLMDNTEHPLRMTLHEDIELLSKVLLRKIIYSQKQPLEQRLYKIFRSQKELAIVDIEIKFREK
jgi:hypothetical protein